MEYSPVVRVHIVDQSGKEHEIECGHVQEGDHGLYLLDKPGSTSQFTIGYVPYDQLDYVEPTAGKG